MYRSLSNIMDSIILSVLAAVTVLDITVSAQNCYTPNNAIGKCIPINYCLPLWAVFQDSYRSEEDARYLMNSQCNYQESTLYVCCPLLDQNNGGCIFGTCTELTYCPSVWRQSYSYSFEQDRQEYLRSVACNGQKSFSVCCEENAHGGTFLQPGINTPSFYLVPPTNDGYYPIYTNVPGGVNIYYPSSPTPNTPNGGNYYPIYTTEPNDSNNNYNPLIPTPPEGDGQDSNTIDNNTVTDPDEDAHENTPEPTTLSPNVPLNNVSNDVDPVTPIITKPPVINPPISIPPIIVPPVTVPQVKPPQHYPDGSNIVQFAPPYSDVDTSIGLKLLPHPGKCGVSSSEDKIIGGNETGLTQYPWIGLIEYIASNNSIRVACGSSLITSRYVLTAGHCLTASIVQRIGKPLYVRLGEYDRRQMVDCLPLNGGRQECNERPLRIPIESVSIHPNYNENAKNHRNDIALIRLQREAPYTDFIRPICLPTYDISQRLDGPFQLTVAGWGTTERGGSSNRKLHVNLPLVDIETCQNYYLKSRLKASLWPHQLCAGGELGKDSCRGDSGGPLMMEEGSEYQLHGVVSFGPTPCARANIPGVYTKVAAYMPWILSELRD